MKKRSTKMPDLEQKSLLVIIERFGIWYKNTNNAAMPLNASKAKNLFELNN